MLQIKTEDAERIERELRERVEIAQKWYAELPLIARVEMDIAQQLSFVRSGGFEPAADAQVSVRLCDVRELIARALPATIAVALTPTERAFVCAWGTRERNSPDYPHNFAAETAMIEHMTERGLFVVSTMEDEEYGTLTSYGLSDLGREVVAALHAAKDNRDGGK